MDITANSFVLVLTAGHIPHGPQTGNPYHCQHLKDRLREQSILAADMDSTSPHTDHKMCGL